MAKKRPEMTFDERVKKFEEYDRNPEQQYKIFSELGFTYVDDGCDGYCPDCQQKDTCKVAPEIGWETLEDDDLN